MRHRKGFNHLSRTGAHRKAMLSNMASSLIIHKRITTTTPKAKALRTFVEPLITKSKNDSTHSRRVVFSYLKDKVAVSELFREVSPKVADRPGGYTRILKTGHRLGDNAEMCIIELVDFNENLLKSVEETKTRTGRRRRGTRKKPAEAAAKPETLEAATAEEITESTAEDIAEDAMTGEGPEDEARDESEEMGEDESKEA